MVNEGESLVLQMLLQRNKNAVLSGRINGITLLMQAARDSKEEIASMLVKAGANIHEVDDEQGYNLLHHCGDSMCGGVSVFQLLVDHKD